MKPTLLLVEDDDDSRTVLADLLRKKGYQVLSANCGGEAVRLAQKIRFDLVIMDHGLPDGNGCGFMRILHRLFLMEGIAVTANAYAFDHQMSREAGFYAHLNKPVDLAKLCSVIETGLARKNFANGQQPASTAPASTLALWRHVPEME